ncbi:MAG: hypothetical protein ACRD0P_31200, partial [Stackebrandtia sp.]
MTFVHDVRGRRFGTVMSVKVPAWLTAVWSPRVPAAKPTPRQTWLRDAGWWSLAMLFVAPAMLLGNTGTAGQGLWPLFATGLGFAVVLRVRRTVPMAALLTVVVLGAWVAVETSSSAYQAWPQLVLFCLIALSYLVGRLDDGRRPMPLQVGASVVL